MNLALSVKIAVAGLAPSPTKQLVYNFRPSRDVSTNHGEVFMSAFYSAGRKNGLNSSLSKKETARATVDNMTAAKSNPAKFGALIPAMHDGRVRKILQVIESHPSRKVHELALECNLSESHLRHLFKQRTGLGLGRLLTEQRMRLATDFLEHTSLSIKEIACSVGYEHTSSFIRAFERHFGQAPNCYRQKRCRYETVA
jgi:transcriptional regulator GlxA family with amidase domain